MSKLISKWRRLFPFVFRTERKSTTTPRKFWHSFCVNIVVRIAICVIFHLIVKHYANTLYCILVHSHSFGNTKNWADANVLRKGHFRDELWLYSKRYVVMRKIVTFYSYKWSCWLPRCSNICKKRFFHARSTA